MPNVNIPTLNRVRFKFRVWLHTPSPVVGIPATRLVEFIVKSGRNPILLPFSEQPKAVQPPKAEAVQPPKAEAVQPKAVEVTKKKSEPRGASGDPMAKPVPPPSVVHPLAVSLTHELAVDRLWARLDKLCNHAPPKRMDHQDVRTVLVKDTKTKLLYMVCTATTGTEVDLAALQHKLNTPGGLRTAGPADVEVAIALTKGCVTPLWLYNNIQGTVVPVFDAKLMAKPDEALLVCAGCDAHGHFDATAAHNCVRVSVNQMLELINEAKPREHVVVEF
jgi:hypothetical protein